MMTRLHGSPVHRTGPSPLGRRPARWRSEAGVTLIELLVYMVVAGIVMASVYQMMVTQSRNFTDQREITDARETVRGAAALLSAELRQVAPADSDLYFMHSDSIGLRSITSSGYLCGWDKANRRYALWSVAGEIDEGTVDSALIYAVATDAWEVIDIQNLMKPSVAGLGTCQWSAGGSADTVATVSNASDDVQLGAPFRSFRPIQYGMFYEDGRWWLGRKTVGGTYEKLTGPLLSPANGGLVFNYYAIDGATTAVADSVVTVEFIIRSESSGQSIQRDGLSARKDSIRTRVYLRG